MRSLAAGLLLVFAICFASHASAADPSGAWKSAITFNDQVLETTLEFKLDSEGGFLTGSERAGQQNPDPITRAHFKNGNISFAVNHDFAGQKVVFKYSGKLDGDTITGRGSVDHGDRIETTSWVAKRRK